MFGLLLLDKPLGMSSNRALQRAKRLFAAAKAGHTGSLDPLATGMLPIFFGAATRLASYMLEARKTYRVVATLGSATTTGDAEGETIEDRGSQGPPAPAAIEAAVSRFIGETEQIPPMYSALKRDGVPLYRLARSGVDVERAPRRVVIEALEIEALRLAALHLRVRCSKGTYVRTLVEDVAKAAGTLDTWPRFAASPWGPSPRATEDVRGHRGRGDRRHGPPRRPVAAGRRCARGLVFGTGALERCGSAGGRAVRGRQRRGAVRSRQDLRGTGALHRHRGGDGRAPPNAHTGVYSLSAWSGTE